LQRNSKHGVIISRYLSLCLCGAAVWAVDWMGLSSVLRPCQHSEGYMGDGFYRSKDPTNSIKYLIKRSWVRFPAGP